MYKHRNLPKKKKKKQQRAKDENSQEAHHGGNGPLIDYKLLKQCMLQFPDTLSFPTFVPHLQ